MCSRRVTITLVHCQAIVTDSCTVWDAGTRSDCASISSPPPPNASPTMPMVNTTLPPVAQPLTSCYAHQDEYLPEGFNVYVYEPRVNARCFNGAGYTQLCINGFDRITAVCTQTNYVTATCGMIYNPVSFRSDGSFYSLTSSRLPVNCIDYFDPNLVRAVCP